MNRLSLLHPELHFIGVLFLLQPDVLLGQFFQTLLKGLFAVFQQVDLLGSHPQLPFQYFIFSQRFFSILVVAEDGGPQFLDLDRLLQDSFVLVSSLLSELLEHHLSFLQVPPQSVVLLAYGIKLFSVLESSRAVRGYSTIARLTFGCSVQNPLSRIARASSTT